MQDAFLTIVQTTVTTNKKGEEETKEDAIYEFVVLRKSHREQLMQNIERICAEAEAKQKELEEKAGDVTPDDLRIDTGNS